MANQIPKKRAAALATVRPRKALPIEEAVALVKSSAYAKFDESVDIAVRLGVNPKHADQMVRGAIVLPHGTGKSVRVARVRQGRQGEGSQRGGRRPRWAATTWWPRSRMACSTSTWPSRRRT